jgi:predicted RNase H-like HicB family nuclease
MKVAGYVILTHEYYKEGRRWVATCKELGTSTYGRSISEAEDRLQDAVLCHLDSLEDVGETSRFFKENNIEFYRVKPKHSVSVNVPIDKEIFVQSHVQSIPVGAC